MSQGTETPATGNDEDAGTDDARDRSRADERAAGRHRAGASPSPRETDPADPPTETGATPTRRDDATDPSEAVTGETPAPAPRRAPTPPQGFGAQGFGAPGGGFRPQTGGFRPGPPTGDSRPAPPTGGFPAAGRPGSYGPFDPPSYPGRGPYPPGWSGNYAAGDDAGYDFDDEDDAAPAGNVAAVISLVLALVGILLSCRPFVFGSTAMAPDTYVALAISVIALVLGVVGARNPVRRPAAVLGIAGSVVAMMIVAILPTL